jgi:integrase
MAIVKRKDNEGIVFFVTNMWNGRQKSERVGRNIREAQRRDAAMKKEIANGTYQPPKLRRSMSFGDFATMWHGKRTNKWAAGERAYTKNHFESRKWFWSKPLNEFRPVDIDQLIAEMRAVKKPDGSRKLSDKTISDILGQLKRMFNSAIRAEVCDRQPVTLEPGTIKRTSKIRQPYTAAEAAILTRHHLIPWQTRVQIALWVLAGLRQGEGCGLTWSKLDLDAKPLPCLDIDVQWTGETLKTERPRRVPVHPELLAILRAWSETGFELYTGRKPTADDYIVPGLDKSGRTKCFGADASYRRFREACALVGITARTLHSFRHTFVTLCRRGGARADVLERVTHNASGKMIDRYTHFDWLPLCEAVLCLRLEPLPLLPEPEVTTGNGHTPALPEASESPQKGTICADSSTVVCRPLDSPTSTNHAPVPIGTGIVQEVIQGSDRARGGVYRSALVKTNRLKLERLSALAAYDSRDYSDELTVARGLAKVYAGDVPGAVELLREQACRRSGGAK